MTRIDWIEHHAKLDADQAYPRLQNNWVEYFSFPMPGIDEDDALTDRCCSSAVPTIR